MGTRFNAQPPRFDRTPRSFSSPRPATRFTSSASDATFSYIDPASAGWSFYCAGTQTSIPHPQMAQFTTVTPAYTLATACAGKPPTLARLGFSLDPWGRAAGFDRQSAYGSRYNVRTVGFALNLVGSGIRDCQKVADPAACYSEPFIRYDSGTPVQPGSRVTSRIGELSSCPMEPSVRMARHWHPKNGSMRLPTVSTTRCELNVAR